MTFCDDLNPVCKDMKRGLGRMPASSGLLPCFVFRDSRIDHGGAENTEVSESKEINMTCLLSYGLAAMKPRMGAICIAPGD